MHKSISDLQDPTGGDARQEAASLWTDASLLLANLRQTPLERIRADDRALSLVMALRKAMRERHAQS